MPTIALVPFADGSDRVVLTIVCTRDESVWALEALDIAAEADQEVADELSKDTERAIAWRSEVHRVLEVTPK